MATEHVPVLVLESKDVRTEVYILNPGDIFDDFGGSKQGLTVRKTASLIIRHTHHQGDQTDFEYDVNDLAVWDRLVEIMRLPGVVTKSGGAYA